MTRIDLSVSTAVQRAMSSWCVFKGRMSRIPSVIIISQLPRIYYPYDQSISLQKGDCNLLAKWRRGEGGMIQMTRSIKKSFVKEVMYGEYSEASTQGTGWEVHSTLWIAMDNSNIETFRTRIFLLFTGNISTRYVFFHQKFRTISQLQVVGKHIHMGIQSTERIIGKLLTLETSLSFSIDWPIPSHLLNYLLNNISILKSCITWIQLHVMCAR